METLQTYPNGARCRAARYIRGHQGIVARASEGTILYGLYNLDRQLINVEWDNGLRMTVFPGEIEIVDRGSRN